LAEFDSDHANRYATGKSAGLAFAVEFSRTIITKCVEQPLPSSVAVTGIISNSSKFAKVMPVTALGNKFTRAFNILARDDFIIYPQENAAEIDSVYANLGANIIVQCIPVNTVADAVTVLLQQADFVPQPIASGFSEIRKGVSNSRRFLKPFILMVSLFALFVSLFQIWDQKDTDTTIIQLLQNGEFVEAGETLREMHAVGGDTLPPEFMQLKDQMNTELSLELKFEYWKPFNTKKNDREYSRSHIKYT